MEKMSFKPKKDLKAVFPSKNWNKLHLQIIWYGMSIVKLEIVLVCLAKFVKAVTQIEKNYYKKSLK